MAKIEDFEKRYVSTVVFNEGDQILVTKENIEDLRKALKNTNFHWRTGEQIIDDESASFEPNHIIHLHEQNSHFNYLEDYKANQKNQQVIHYVFVNY